MKASITLTPTLFDKMTNTVTTLLQQPVAALAGYYSGVLDRPVSIRQTWQLLNAQLAFFLTAFSSCGLLLRCLCIVWLCTALLQCRASFGQRDDE